METLSHFVCEYGTDYGFKSPRSLSRSTLSVLLTHEARLHILSNVVSHARPVVPPLLQGLVVHIDYFVPNLIANAETSVLIETECTMESPSLSVVV